MPGTAFGIGERLTAPQAGNGPLPNFLKFCKSQETNSWVQRLKFNECDPSSFMSSDDPQLLDARNLNSEIDFL